MIHLQDFGYRFAGSDRPTLEHINLEVASGEFLVLTGPSGCGKSTLALALGGFLFNQYEGEACGSIRVGGLDARERPIYEIAEIVGLVQQNPEAQFCTLSVRDEIAFGLENRRLPENEMRLRLEWALEVTGARHLAQRSLAELSGGEQQKIAIASILAARPQVLIFDEPTANLDPSATAEIFALIAHIRVTAGLTVIVIEHKLDYLAPFQPRILEMQDGQLRGELPAEMAAARWQPPPSSSRRRPHPAEIPSLQIEALSCGHGPQDSLHNISASFYPGEFIAILGDNGAGKTTLLHSLLGLLRPRQGCIRLFGRDTRYLPVSTLARQIALVFQNPEHQLFAPSVWEEAIFAPHNLELLDEAVTMRAEAMLTAAGLAERQSSHPYRLSYGQKRRLNLISVLTYHPAVILLDEILIGQDPLNAFFLLDLLVAEAIKGATIVMVNHNPHITAHYADRLIFLSAGEILVDAPPEAAFEKLAAAGKSAFLPPPNWKLAGAPV